MGFEPTNGSLGSYCLTTWRHPLKRRDYTGDGRGLSMKLAPQKVQGEANSPADRAVGGASIGRLNGVFAFGCDQANREFVPGRSAV